MKTPLQKHSRVVGSGSWVPALDSFAHLGWLLRLTHLCAIQCLTFLSTIKLSQTNLKLPQKKRRKQSRIKKSHSPSIRNSCFHLKASFSRLLKLNKRYLRPGLNCNNSFCGLVLTLCMQANSPYNFNEISVRQVLRMNIIISIRGVIFSDVMVSICSSSPCAFFKLQKFGFINGVDNVNWPPYRDSKS